MSGPFSLAGRLALVTGGGTGIGLGIARCFVAAGARVVITGRREEVLRAGTQELGPGASYRVSDVTDRAALPALVRDIEGREGPVDVLVNNAGVHHKAPAQDTSDADFARVLDTNLLSVFSLTREVARGMIARGGGSIIMISSMAGLFGIDRVVAYGASKTALTGLVNGLVTEYSQYGVRVNAIAPGWIESPMFLRAVAADPARREQITRRIALDHFGQPEDIGHAAVYLASPAGRYVTGVVLPVDGGATVNF